MKNNIYTAVLLAFAVLFVGCTDDDLDGMAVNEKSTATTSVSSLTILEGRSDVIPFTISQAINVPSQFKILVTGDAINDDLPFSAGNGMDADTGIPGQGFEVTVPAYASSFSTLDKPSLTNNEAIFAVSTEPSLLLTSTVDLALIVPLVILPIPRRPR